MEELLPHATQKGRNMNHSADHRRKCGNNKMCTCSVSNTESDEFIEESVPSTHNEVSQPMRSEQNIYQVTEKGASHSNSSANASELLAEQSGKPLEEPTEHQLCQTNESEEFTEKCISNFRLVLICASPILYSVFNVMQFYDAIIYQHIHDLLFYGPTSIIYFLSAIVTNYFSTNINRLKTTERKDVVNTYYRRGALIAAFVTIEIFHIYFRVIFGKGIYDPHKICVIIFKILIIPIGCFVLLHLRTLEIYILMSFYAIKSRRSHCQKEKQCYYNQVTKTQADVGLLTILDGSFRTIPLQILQITVFLKSKDNLKNFSYLQEAGILLSFFAIAWSSTSYQSSLRVKSPTKHDMKLNSMCWYYFWNFLYCFSRTLCIGAIATFWPFITATVALIHCAGWGFWLWWSHPPLPFCHNSEFWHSAFCFVMGVIYFTFPINLDDKPTKKRYCIFYLIMLFENLFGVIVWYLNEQDAPWNHLGLFLAIVSFILGVICQIVYYRFYHPNKVYTRNRTGISN